MLKRQYNWPFHLAPSALEPKKIRRIKRHIRRTHDRAENDNNPFNLQRLHNWGLTPRSIIPALLLIAICLFTPFITRAELADGDEAEIQRYLQFVKPSYDLKYECLRYGESGHSDGIHMYCLLKSGKPELHICFYLQGGEWTFYNKVRLYADTSSEELHINEKIEKTLDLDGPLVWEMADRAFGAAYIDFLRKFIASKSAVIYFQGERSQRSRTVTVPEWQKEHLRVMLNLYEHFQSLQPAQ